MRRPDAPVQGPVVAYAERQRQQFDERDRAIRDAARRLLLERGLHGFSMDDGPRRSPTSKGTVYQHYDSKEDVLVASCAEAAAEARRDVRARGRACRCLARA
jgi:AcrR family transcriptional regulator